MQKMLFILSLFIHALLANGQADVNATQKKILLDNPQPLIVGHRGGFDARLPENSISLFDFTFKNSCHAPIGIEFDIRESASGSLYVMHDSTVDRTTNGTGKINMLTDSYIKTLFLKDRNGILTSEKVPLFSEVLTHFQDKNIVLMLDVKGKIYPKVIRLVSEMKMEYKCILLTFSQNNTRLVKESTSKIMILALVLNKADWESLLKLQIPNDQLIAYIDKNTPPDIIREIYKKKVLIMTNMSESIYNNSKQYDPGYYRYFLEKKHLGIMITDYPQFVNKIFCIE